MTPILLALAFLAQAAAAPGAAEASLPPAAAPAAASPPAVTGEKLKFGIVEGKNVEKGGTVCLDDALSGSRIPKKRCMSREEFKIRQAEQQDHLSTIQRDARAPRSN